MYICFYKQCGGGVVTQLDRCVVVLLTCPPTLTDSQWKRGGKGGVSIQEAGHLQQPKHSG